MTVAADRPGFSVDDIRPAAVMADQQAAMQHDIDWLAQHRNQFEAVSCPACGQADAVALYEKYGMHHVRCGACVTQYVSPRPSQPLLARFYAQSANYAYWAQHIFPASADARRVNLFRPRARHAAALMRAANVDGGTLVEVGAAFGLFCDEARATGAFDRVVAIEPTPDLAAICRDLGLETHQCPYEKVTIDHGAHMVAAFEVIEHLHTPVDFLHWCHGILRPGGLVMLTCPNSRGLETLALGKAAGAVDHEHLNLFHPDSLRALAARCGFVDVAITTPGELDVELVAAALDDGAIDEKALGPFIGAVMADRDPIVLAKLQAFVRDAGYSSHMMMVARRVP